MSGAAVEARALRKQYGGEEGIQALRDASLAVLPGDYAAIMGPSGSGKSTLLNILGCLDIADGGEYRIDGRPVEGLSRGELANLRHRVIGFVFQSFFLLPRLTALENVELPLTIGGMDPAKRRRAARRMLERVGLPDREKHMPDELSGGQRQRVAIARALINNPGLVLADEPTGSLDTHTGEEIMQLLGEVNAAGTTVLLITHEPEIAAHARRQFVMRDGVLREVSSC